MSDEQTQSNPATVDDAVFGSKGDDYFAALEMMSMALYKMT